jgi:hypothetical protein
VAIGGGVYYLLSALRPRPVVQARA